MEISAGLVRSGLGISFLPRDFYKEELKSGEMVELKTYPMLPVVEFSIISKKEGPEYVKDIISLAKDVANLN